MFEKVRYWCANGSLYKSTKNMNDLGANGKTKYFLHFLSHNQPTLFVEIFPALITMSPAEYIYQHNLM